MGQSRVTSLLEALCGTGVAFALSVLLQRLLFPAMGHAFSWDENIRISLAFTALSLVRSYLVRRLFNRCQPEKEAAVNVPNAAALPSPPVA